MIWGLVDKSDFNGQSRVGKGATPSRGNRISKRMEGSSEAAE